MSILEALGAGPSNLTVPLTVATVAGSIGVAGAAAAGCSAAGLAAGASSFLLQAASASSTHNASAAKLTRINLLFIEGRPLCDLFSLTIVASNRRESGGDSRNCS